MKIYGAIYPRFKKFAFLTLVFLIVYSIFRPWVNPSPVSLVRLEGTFPFDKGYKLEFLISAHTTNPLARFICGGFGFFNGATGIDCQGGRKAIEPTIIGCCSYELKYYGDYFLKGPLSWVASPIYYRIHGGGVSNAVWSGFPNKEANIDCNKKAVQNKANHFYCVEKISANHVGNENNLRIDFSVIDKTQEKGEGYGLQ